MTSKQDAVQYCLTFKNVFEDYPFKDHTWACMRIQSTNRIFAWIYERHGHIWINVKCDPQWRDFWRNAFSSVVPAYHMNKEHWNSIILDKGVPDKEIKRMIAESYELCCGVKR